LQTSHAQDKFNPERNPKAMLLKEKKEEIRNRSTNAYYAKRKMTMQVETSTIILNTGDATVNAVSV